MLGSLTTSTLAGVLCIATAFAVLVVLGLVVTNRPPHERKAIVRPKRSRSDTIRKTQSSAADRVRPRMPPPVTLESILLDPIWDESDKEWKDEHQVDADRKGAAGEALVRSMIENLGMEALHDVYLPTARGATQIDHAVRCGSTIVVVETKHYSGSVAGGRTDDRWIQTFANGRTFPFLNPLLQNAKHVEAMRNFTGADVRGLVVFTGYATFPYGRPGGVLIAPELRAALENIQEAFPDRSSRPDWAILRRHARSTPMDLKDAHARSIRVAKRRDVSLSS